MKKRSMAVALVAAAYLAVPPTTHAQTAQQRLAEAVRLQQAMHRQDAAGDLDAAIAIYRELATSSGTDRAVAAEAQYRLAQSLLQKGELDAGAQELSTLARVFPDHAALVSRLAGSSGLPGGMSLPGPSSLPEFEPGTPASVVGRITMFAWVSPMAWMKVTDGTSTWTLAVAAPNMMVRLGVVRDAFKPGDELRIDMTLDRRGPVLTDGTILARADVITRASDGVQIFNRAALDALQP
jgi:hypothetical protein